MLCLIDMFIYCLNNVFYPKIFTIFIFISIKKHVKIFETSWKVYIIYTRFFSFQAFILHWENVCKYAILDIIVRNLHFFFYISSQLHHENENYLRSQLCFIWKLLEKHYLFYYAWISTEQNLFTYYHKISMFYISFIFIRYTNHF